VSHPVNRSILDQATDSILIVPTSASSLTVAIQSTILQVTSFKSHHQLVLKAENRIMVHAYDGKLATAKAFPARDLDLDLERECKQRILAAAYYAMPFLSVARTDELSHYLSSLSYLPLCEYIDASAPYLVSCQGAINELALTHCPVDRAVFLEAYLQDVRMDRELEKLSVTGKYHH
jgi:hypothetical protein